MTWNVRVGINPISWMNDDLPSLGEKPRWKLLSVRARKLATSALSWATNFPRMVPA